ncbi:MAG: pyridoxamine 5'-phosphate oxidase family protein [Solobacterium sp.]|nr:pyridoxamine 5'-phosphate oxidase family protein [Solobacterium sp.]
MFRELTRKKQQLPAEECIDVLKTALRGVLAVNGDGGYPYAVPVNHYYDEEEGLLYFHGGKTGHKIDALRRDAKVSFAVFDEGHRNEGEWFLTFRSVIVFGIAEEVTDHDKAMDVSRKLSYKFTQDEAYIDNEILHSGPGTLCFAIRPENITGKLVRER